MRPLVYPPEFGAASDVLLQIAIGVFVVGALMALVACVLAGVRALAENIVAREAASAKGKRSTYVAPGGSR